MPYFNKKYNFFFVIFLFSLVLTSCKEENPNPELLDPIFSHLQKQEKEFAKLVEDKKKEIKSVQKDLKSSLPRSPGRIVANKSYKKAVKALVFLEQKAKYYKIRAEHRKFEGRKSYKLAFSQNKAWPDPKEYQNYLTNNRLKEINLNWSARVPKLFEKNPNYKAK
ncbi:MAG: hypothetical protein HOO06_00680 [Bdellovibrionaceae bacterium]|nr:hypothetical protein [Pseudobdellovibrionaceae bacterium]